MQVAKKVQTVNLNQSIFKIVANYIYVDWLIDELWWKKNSDILLN